MAKTAFEIEVVDDLSGAMRKLAAQALSLADTIKRFRKAYQHSRHLFFSKHSGRMIFARR